MLTPIPLTEKITVSPQILPSEVKKIADLGFKSIINNRPDNEESDQPSSQQIKQLATDLGLEYFYLPVISGNIHPNQSEQFAELLENAPKPVLAFCRTGTRCSALWSMASQDVDTFNARISRAKEVGYDLSWVTQPQFGKHQR